MKEPYFQVKVLGSSASPTITFSCRESILPVVPLGVEAKTRIQINNNGYEAITIYKWKLSNNFQFVEIHVNFIQGRLLSMGKKSLSVEISFTSQVAISFTTMLEFYD